MWNARHTVITPPNSCIEEGTILCACACVCVCGGGGGCLGGFGLVYLFIHSCAHPRIERERGKKLPFITVSVANSGIKSEMHHNQYILHNLLCILMYCNVISCQIPFQNI